MKIENRVAATPDAISFFAWLHAEMKKIFKEKGYVLGQADLALCDRGDFVLIPGARWYAITGRVGDRDGLVKEFRKEFAARIGPDTDRDDIRELAQSLVAETEAEFHSSRGVIAVG